MQPTFRGRVFAVRCAAGAVGPHLNVSEPLAALFSKGVVGIIRIELVQLDYPQISTPANHLLGEVRGMPYPRAGL